jgi:hypothetical protein
MKKPTVEEVTQAYSHEALALWVIELEMAFRRLMELPASDEQAAIIRGAFPLPAPTGGR